MDAQEGIITWEAKPLESCARDSYLVLYRGLASKIAVKQSEKSTNAYTLHSIQDGKLLATLIEKGYKTVCGIKLAITDHPKRLVHEYKDGTSYFIKDPLSAKNMDIFLYVNAKFTHIERHMRKKMSRMYEIMLKEQCETKRDLLRRHRTLATLDPVEFAYAYIGQPGFTAVVMGEQLHLIKYNPEYVATRKTEGCYN